MTQGPDFPLTPPPIPASLASLLGPLRHCPHCRYDLTGLPRNHRCPECGQPYDETMLELRTGIHRRLRIAVAVVLLALIPGWGIGIACFSSAGSAGSDFLVWFLWACGLAVVLVNAVVPLASRCRQCFITPDGLMLFTNRGGLCVPWPTASSIQVVPTIFLDRDMRIDQHLLGAAVVRRKHVPILCTRATAAELSWFLFSYRTFALARSQNGPVGRNGVAIPDAQKPSSEP